MNGWFDCCWPIASSWGRIPSYQFTLYFRSPATKIISQEVQETYHPSRSRHDSALVLLSETNIHFHLSILSPGWRRCSKDDPFSWRYFRSKSEFPSTNLNLTFGLNPESHYHGNLSPPHRCLPQRQSLVTWYVSRMFGSNRDSNEKFKIVCFRNEKSLNVSLKPPVHKTLLGKRRDFPVRGNCRISKKEVL